MMILVIDDDQAIRSSLAFLLKRARYEVQTAADPQEAMEVVRSTSPDLILMDMNFSHSTSGDEGLLLLRQVKIFRPDVPVILITAWGSIDLAVRGMRAGAFDFIPKPWNNIALLQRIQTAIELNRQKQEPQEERPLAELFDRSPIIGKSRALMNVLNTVERIAPTQASVLITGESGTGKELIAEAIHRNSPRRNEPFVKVNLGGISQSLFESEMFGHKKGAFTGAVADRKGRFEMADRGTIFLDEIGELDINSQVKLLRVLQEQTFERLGDSRPHKIDIRVVSATNADLEQMVAAHTFREDLYYRINLITIHLPSLKERKEDIPLLVNSFADKQSRAIQAAPVTVTEEAMAWLSSLPYRGNIRELKNLVERTILISGKSLLTADDFKRQYNNGAPMGSESLSGLTLDEIERQTILRSMDSHHNCISLVAADLGISRAAVYRRLKKYDIHIDESM